jgi:hypothetical protein
MEKAISNSPNSGSATGGKSDKKSSICPTPSLEHHGWKKRQTIWTSATLRQLEETDREVAFGGTNYGVITMAMTARMTLAEFHQKVES